MLAVFGVGGWSYLRVSILLASDRSVIRGFIAWSEFVSGIRRGSCADTWRQLLETPLRCSTCGELMLVSTV